MTKTTEFNSQDRQYMMAAIALAGRGLGNVWPNPSVGCILVNNRKIVGRGWTQPSGRPHAESKALEMAGDAARGSTAYVTLEPCSHHGKTKPCVESLINAKISRLVASMEDPDPRVSGQGFSAMDAAGVEVLVGLGEECARYLNAGFIKRINVGQPLVTFKMAISLDGKGATSFGESKWITNKLSRSQGHLLRANHDAILIGSGTAIADNPLLTCRLPGLLGTSPVRVIMDGRLLTPIKNKVIRSARITPTWIITVKGKSSEEKLNYERHGVKIFEVDGDSEGHPDVIKALKILGTQGITRVLLEGGPKIAAAFIRARGVDRLVSFRSPIIIGGDGSPVIEGLALKKLERAPTFSPHTVSQLGSNVFETFDICG